MTQQPTLSANRVDAKARGDHARPELALADELSRVITYRDQTGEDAVNNVLRGGL